MNLKPLNCLHSSLSASLLYNLFLNRHDPLNKWQLIHEQKKGMKPRSIPYRYHPPTVYSDKI